MAVLLCALSPPVQAIDFPAGTLQGSVTWDGAAVSGRSVGAFNLLIPEVGSRGAQSDGSYSFTALPPGTYTVSVYAPGCGVHPPNKVGEAQAHIVADSTTQLDFDITSSVGRISGAITVNGAPLPHPGLDVMGHCGSWGGDADGTFSHYLLPGSYTANVYGPSGRLGGFNFDLVAGQTTDVGTTDIQSGSLQGSIIWDGAAVSGRSVGAFNLLIPEVGSRGAQSDGSYSFTALPPGTYTVSVYAPGCGVHPPNKVGEAQAHIVADSTTQLDFDITSSVGRISGAITVNGAPLPHPGLDVMGHCGSWGGDADGTFSHYLLPGSYTANVYGPSGRLGGFNFDLVAGQTTDVGTTDIQSGSLQGSIIWDGAAVSGRSVGAFNLLIPEVGSRGAQSDGSYSFTALPPGTYTVSVYAPGCGVHPPNKVGEAQAHIVADSTTQLDFDITSSVGRISGAITVNGAPLPHPGLDVMGHCGSWGGDADGTFSHYLLPGSYTANVYGPSGRLGGFNFDLVAGQTTDVDFGSTPAGNDVQVELSGGVAEPGGVGLTFDTVSTGGNTVVVESGAGPPPPTGYSVVGIAGEPRYWDLETTATYTGPITVCIHYDPSQVEGPEDALLLMHDAGAGFVDITTNLDTEADVICGETDSLSPFAVVEPLQGRYNPLTPSRVLDTRNGVGVGGVAGPVGPAATLEVQVTGQGGVPTSGVSAVALNVTATQPTDSGFLTLFPAGSPQPLAANLNFTPNKTVPNLVVVRVGDDGKVAMFNSAGSTHVVYDVAGWYSNDPTGNDGRYTALVPARILDTRLNAGGVRLAPGASLELQVSGTGGVPASGATAAVINLAATATTATSFLTVHPTGTPLPLAANLNFKSGDTVSNRAIVKLGTGGRVTIYNHLGSADVVVDVSGWFSDSSVAGTTGIYTALTPARILDTRDGTGGISGPRPSRSTVDVQVAGRGGIPLTGVSAVIFNATVVGPTGGGYLTAFPTGTAKPLASDLNYASGEIRPNLVVAKVGTDGKVSLYTHTGAHVVFDVAGWIS